MNTELNNQVALVSGASRGIGRAIAMQLAQAGATVIGTATSEAGAAAIGEALQAHGGRGEVLDVSSADSIDALFSRLKEAGLQVDVLVNNAGITVDKLLLRMGEDDWQRVIDTDLTSVFRMSKAVIRGMMKARGGRIINVGSVIGSMGNAGQANYAAAKAGLIGFTKSLAREVGSRGITVNTVAPGYIQTDMTAQLDEQQTGALMSQVPLGRLGCADDIAAAVLFLASPMASYITGETLHVNGGMLMP